MATQHPVRWQAPQPLWSRFGGNAVSAASAAAAPEQQCPALLRFDSDDFMDQMLATMARDPARLADRIARPETWRRPAGAVPDLIERVPLPRLARLAMRQTAAAAVKGRVTVDGGAATASSASVASATSTAFAASAASDLSNASAAPATSAAAASAASATSAATGLPVAASATATAPATALANDPLKLYQPAHQRHYLVAASLVCAQPGLPDRGVVAGAGEPVHAVLRRLLPDPGAPVGAAPHEWAYVNDADGARWLRVGAPSDAGRAVAGEEPLPLFPLAYADDAGRPRRLWAGTVPVGRRDEYIGTRIDRSGAPAFAAGQQASLAARSAAAAPAGGKLARTTQFQLEVAEPWKTQIRSAFKAADGLRETTEPAGGEPPVRVARRVFDFNLQQQSVSWLLLLDLADFLQAHLPAVWQAVADAADAGAALAGRPREVFDFLVGATMGAGLVEGLKRPPDVAPVGPLVRTPVRPPAATLRDALREIRQPGVRERLESTTLNYDAGNTGDAAWPGFHFVLAGVSATDLAPRGAFEALAGLVAADADTPAADPLPGPAIPSAQRSDEEKRQAAARQAAAGVDRLTSLVARALAADGDAAAPPLPFALQLRNTLAGAGAAGSDLAWFVIRFVHARTDCGPLHPPLVSAPTAAFQLAGFFDPDAPARPIRITLPVDTSPAGLRKFNRNTAFVVSDMLCGQIQRAKGLGLVDLVRSVLPWPLHKDLDVPSGSCQTDAGLSLGMICSLSIPIITICALLLLIVIVTLLDFVFRWLPYFAICFPVPGLKGKK